MLNVVWIRCLKSGGRAVLAGIVPDTSVAFIVNTLVVLPVL